jgi:hypothetical protein
VKTDLDVKRRVEAHLEMTLIILVEQTQKALFEDRGCERVGEDNNTIRRARQRFHLLQPDLI